MEKEFVTYEIASRMRKLGFDEECLMYYNEVYPNKFELDLFEDDDALRTIKAPLWQQCERWLWENYQILVYPYLPPDGPLLWIVESDIYNYCQNREEAILKATEIC